MALALSQPRPPRQASYFARVAADLWAGDWDTIIATRAACDHERLHLEAFILCHYGKSLSLRGTPERVRDTLAAARARPAAA